MLPPIAVVGCTTGVTHSDMLVKTDGDYRITFVNKDDRRTADDVWFIVHLGQQQVLIHDSGKFAPGVTISHRFANRGGEIVIVGDPRITCEVQAVHFADGTEWTSPVE